MNEHIASIACILCFLFQWERSLASKRAEASAIINDIFGKLLSITGDVVQFVNCVPPHNIRHLCPMAGHGRSCCHCQALVQSLIAGGLRWEGLHGFLTSLWALYDKHRCGYAGLWFKTQSDVSGRATLR